MMIPAYHEPKIRWNSVRTVSLLCVLLETLGSGVDAACTKYCAPGDVLSGSTCTTSVAASDSCPSRFSARGGQCVDADARCSGIISTMYDSIGQCCSGTKRTPATTSSGSSCFPSDGGPGGFYCRTSSTVGCYSNRGSPSSCPSGSSADGNDCVRSLTYTCPSGYTLSGTNCTDTYAAFTITTSTQCNISNPATDGCQWCSAISACLPDAASCPASCLVTPQAMCMNIPSACQWCSAIGVCQKDSIGCFASCLTATTDSNICDASTSCKYCTAIGVCQPDAGLCYATCLAATAESNVCDGSTSCKYCATPGSIGVCQPNGAVCYTSCLAATVESNVCDGSTSCKYCSTTESIGVCQPNAGICYTTCLTASAESTVCGGSVSCQWCATSTSIGVCQLKAGTCWGTCPPATDDPLGSGVCSTSQSCKWCPASAGGVGGIGVCQPSGGTCWASCLSATTDSSNTAVCGYSTECQWCTLSTSIGVCQPRGGTCWATCMPASDDPLSPALCTTSLDCKWCPTLGYCTEQARECHTQCTAVAPDEPAICQVQSIQAQCQWCSSVEYCVARTDELRLRCAASCGGLIWRKDVCDGALECHWCGVHNAAQGGRCKPLPGKSRGYVAWRHEVECDTESTTYSFSSQTSGTVSWSVSLSRYRSYSTSVSESNNRTTSLTATVTRTSSPSVSLSANATFSVLNSQSDSLSLASLTSALTNSTSSSMTLIMTGRTDTVSVSDTTSLSISTTTTASPTASHELTATRYYSRDRTLVEAVATYLALGLMVPSVVGGIGGGTMTSSLSRVLAARNLGQCWGQAGGSVFSLLVDVCSYTANDEEQLEGQGDAVIGVVLVLCGALLLAVGGIGYWKLKQVSFRMAAEDLSLVSVLTPLWVAAVPIIVGGAVTATVAPMSSEHPLANTCGATAALVAVCFALTLLLLVVLAVVPMAVPALFGVECRRGKPPRSISDTASLPVRSMTWFRRSGRRWWQGTHKYCLNELLVSSDGAYLAPRVPCVVVQCFRCHRCVRRLCARHNRSLLIMDPVRGDRSDCCSTVCCAVACMPPQSANGKTLRLVRLQCYVGTDVDEQHTTSCVRRIDHRR